MQLNNYGMLITQFKILKISKKHQIEPLENYKLCKLVKVLQLSENVS